MSLLLLSPSTPLIIEKFTLIVVMSPKLTAIQFLDYSKDYPAQHAFYRDDIELMLPDLTISLLKGKQAIIEHITRSTKMPRRLSFP